ncbi:uncharacterized protein MELLADRAFT_68543 [Melampsora larici-populina 98AG31]|uniref:Uncharacterized protein n=1 Tax=Melampsora larici-populina (strain 98AG31 / pathotype 3-4-7) TaxID=747676 RepID=F4S765_MELLP|nr:uncharacterized protein MELLADRAFT_68543 [Melampsora larici-populina 98AG31]EGF99456.1 hypothetical protein MELLADRAFT_68543 [Melampsora larici-populina 98AG31]
MRLSICYSHLSIWESTASDSFSVAARTSHHWKKGVAVTSLKAVNASSGEGICQSLAKFTRFLLGYDKLTKSYPPAPTDDERCQLRPLSQHEIMSDHKIFGTNSVSAHVSSDDEDIIPFKLLFLSDLKSYGISRMTLDWEKNDKDIWNRTLAVLIVKHWRYAKSEGAFSGESVTPSHNTEKICMGVVLRWIRGRANDVRQNRGSREKVLRKETLRKKQVLFKYRTDSLTRLMKAKKLEQKASEIMPHHDCCSDTEWEPEDTQYPSVGLIWRSQQYASILQQIDGLSYKYCASSRGVVNAHKRFDQCRTKATHTNPHAAVCIGLLENCYDPVFLSNLMPEEKAALHMKPVTSLLNILPPLIEDSVV